jgi:hypothetical protein
MLRRDSRLMGEIIREVGRQPDVQRAMVLDHEGVIRHSSIASELGIAAVGRRPRAWCATNTPRMHAAFDRPGKGGIDVNCAACSHCEPSVPPVSRSVKKLNEFSSGHLAVSVQSQLKADLGRVNATTLLSFVLLAGVGALLRHLILHVWDVCVARPLHRERSDRRTRGGGRQRRHRRARLDFNSIADATSAHRGVRDREQQMSGVLNSLDDGLIVLDRHFRIVATGSRSRSGCARIRKPSAAATAVMPWGICCRAMTTQCVRRPLPLDGTVQRAVYRVDGR